MTNRSRVRMRNLLFLIGIIPALLMVLLVGKVGFMLSAQAAGDSAYDDSKFAEASDRYARNGTLNVLESWLAPFNRGTALFRDSDPEGAIKQFEKALDNVPDKHECKVRTNIALSHEVIGDGLVESDRAAAIEAWQAGRDVLAEGDCPDRDEDAKTVDDRLREKIEEEQQKQEEESGGGEEEQQQQQEEDERKQQELEERNQQGRENRQDNQNYQDYPYRERQPGYQW